jgi:chromosomal replication initiation ATPase DnaA
MAKIVYGVIQKPLVERIVDAACIYFGVEVAFFKEKLHDEESTCRRHILFYLLKEDAGMGYRAISGMFGFSKSSVTEGIELMDFRRGNSRPISEHIRQIRGIAANLEAKIVVMDVKLEHFLGGEPSSRDGSA